MFRSITLRQRMPPDHPARPGQNMAKHSLAEAERADARRLIRQKKRTLIEKVFCMQQSR